MIPEYRQDFNARFTADKYQTFLGLIEQRSRAAVKFRCSETPCFFPRDILLKMADAGADLIHQLVGNDDYLKAADAMIPAGFRAPIPSDRPLFVQADFGITRSPEGEWEPKLVEIQGFPSLYAFQVVLAEAYRDAYSLDSNLGAFLGGLDRSSYLRLFRRAVLGDCDPDHVILLEVDPDQQKTLPDFRMTEEFCGTRTVNIRDLRKIGNRLFVDSDGPEVPVKRIYNRAIADEIIRKGIPLQFSFEDNLDVSWAGHPNWFFRISKFSLPWLKHTVVPATWFLDELDGEFPLPPEQLVLKPLFSFAGLGVTIGPTLEDIRAIPVEQRKDYIVQERVDFVPTIATPPGLAKAEVRIMYLWVDSLVPVNTIVRMGRGTMMGVDQNRDFTWVGASAAFFPM